MMYKIADGCEIEKNQDDDDYIVMSGEDMLIINQSAGIILDYIKKNPSTDEQLIAFLRDEFSLTDEDVNDVMGILGEFKERNIICTTEE